MNPRVVQYLEVPRPGGVTAMVELLVRELADQEPQCLIHPPFESVRQWAGSVRAAESTPAALARPGIFPAWCMPGLVQQLYACFRRARIVHFHLHTPFACTAAILLAHLAGVPSIITTEHYVAQIPFLRRRRLAFPLALIREVRIAAALLLKRWTLRFIDDVVTLSQANRIAFESSLGEQVDPRVHIIHNGIDVERLVTGQDRDPGHPLHPGNDLLLATTVAGLNNQKGHAYLIQAIPAVLRMVPRARFLFVGDGHLHHQLESQVRSLHLDRVVTFAGERTDIGSILAASDLFVLPSLFEGMPMSVLEAMASRRAVVATAVGGTQDLVVHGETGLLVPPADSAALASAIIEVLSDTRKRETFGQRGRLRVEQEFSARRMGAHYHSLYRPYLPSQQP